MPPQETSYSSGIKWNGVTWYSKLGAIILFVGVVPALCFYIGAQYELAQQTIVTPVAIPPVLKNKVVENIFGTYVRDNDASSTFKISFISDTVISIDGSSMGGNNHLAIFSGTTTLNSEAAIFNLEEVNSGCILTVKFTKNMAHIDTTEPICSYGEWGSGAQPDGDYTKEGM